MWPWPLTKGNQYSSLWFHCLYKIEWFRQPYRENRNIINASNWLEICLQMDTNTYTRTRTHIHTYTHIHSKNPDRQTNLSENTCIAPSQFCKCLKRQLGSCPENEQLLFNIKLWYEKLYTILTPLSLTLQTANSTVTNSRFHQVFQNVWNLRQLLSFINKKVKCLEHLNND